MFRREHFAPVETGGATGLWIYKTEDVSLSVLATGYFNDASDVLKRGDAVIAITLHGTIMTYVSEVTDGVVKTQVRVTPSLEGPIAGNNSITRAEIEAILTSYNIELPLDQSISITFNDPDDHPDKAFFCTYDVNFDTWYFEKLDPAT